ERLREWHLTDEALIRYYHCVEAAGRARLAAHHSLQEPYALEAVLAIPGVRPELAKRLKSTARKGRIYLTLALLFEILQALDDPLAQAFFDDGEFQDLLNLRNAYLHNGHPCRPEQVDALRRKTTRFV